MANKRRGVYPYSIDNSTMPATPGPRKSYKKDKRIGRWVFLFLALIILIGAGVFTVKVVRSSSSDSWLPFPKHLLAVRLQHNGKEAILTPDSQCVLNPRDSLQLLEVKTDGMVSWGLKVKVTDIDAELLLKKPLVLKELWPNETFETPKNIELEVFSWNKPIGKVSFLVQLDSRDWIQKANSAEELEPRIAYLEKSLQENSGNVLVKTQLAGLYFESKRYDDAVRLYKEVEESGKSKSILERLLEIYKLQHRTGDAVGVYLDLIRLSEDPDTFKEFLQYVQKTESKEEAAKLLEKHQQEIPKNFHASLFLVVADLSTQTKNWSKAAASYEKAIRVGVKDPDIYYNLAVAYQQNDDFDRAAGAFERYLQKNPADTKTWMQLGHIQEKKGALSQARKTYENVIQKNPQHKEAIVRLLAILEKSNDKTALQSTYEKLAQSQPKDKTVQHNLAVLYYEDKKWDKAADAFEAIAAQDSKDVESRKYLLDIYRKQKDRDGEMKTLRTLSQLEPNNSAYYDALFAAYDEKKDYKGIISLFSELSEKKPDSVAVHNKILYAYVKLGDKKGILKELEQLIRLQPKEKKHLRQAAKLHEGAGDYDAALKNLDQLLKIDPKDKEAKEEYLRIRMLTMSKKKAT